MSYTEHEQGLCSLGPETTSTRPESSACKALQIFSQPQRRPVSASDCYETRLYLYMPESKQQSMVRKHPGSPPPKKARTCKSSGKFMLMFS